MQRSHWFSKQEVQKQGKRRHKTLPLACSIGWSKFTFYLRYLTDDLIHIWNARDRFAVQRVLLVQRLPSLHSCRQDVGEDPLLDARGVSWFRKVSITKGNNLKACVNFTVTRSRAVSSQEMIIECCFNHSKLWVCAVLWLLWLDKPNKQTNQRGHLIMHALLCKMANGDLMLHSQTTVSTQHSTVPELGAWPVGLDRIWLISWWNLQFVTPTLWTTVVMCKPSALAFSRRCVNTSSRAHCTNLLSLVLRDKTQSKPFKQKYF